MSDNLYEMPTSDQLRAACQLIHTTRMALHDDLPVKKRFLPLVGNPHVSTLHLLHNSLNTGHEALWLLCCAMREHEDSLKP